jgi:molybdenum cofactor cytidylyltransferase
MSRCAIVILAAGGSTRMGSAKQSLEFQGETLLQRAVATAMASVCRPIVVVLGARANELQKQLDGLPVSVVINHQWADGMGTSIRCGVAAIGPVDAVMIFLCDQPLITAQHLDQLVAAHFKSDKHITAAFYAGTAGTPVIFGSALFEELQALEDGQGGKALIHRHPEMVGHFPLPQAEMDVDTAEDFARLAKAVDGT